MWNKLECFTCQALLSLSNIYLYSGAHHSSMFWKRKKFYEMGLWLTKCWIEKSSFSLASFYLTKPLSNSILCTVSIPARQKTLKISFIFFKIFRAMPQNVEKPVNYFVKIFKILFHVRLRNFLRGVAAASSFTFFLG